MVACAGSASGEAHDTLDVVTEVTDPIYGVAVRTCRSLEMAVAERDGTSPAEDAADLAKIRVQCDVVVNQFERLIRLQVAARLAIDGFKAGEKTADDVDVAVAAVQAAWVEVRQLLKELGVL